jgi:membrane-associated HD superfamily phosphohydrolase
MKKILTGIVLATLIAAPIMVSAQQPPSDPNYREVEDIDAFEALENVVDWLFTLLLIVAVIFLIIAAFTFITASGDPDKISQARNFVLYALIGVAVAVAAQGLVSLVRNIVAG